MNVKFSIIVPIYNVEEYLEECLNSVMSDEYNNYEVVLINDGSSDRSAEICKKYTEAYPGIIRLINKENEGLCIARNIGIKEAKGEYIIFLDSDDFWERNILVDLDKITIGKADVILGNGFFYEYGDLYERRSHELEDVFSKSDSCEMTLIKFLKSPYNGMTVWEHVYRTDFLRKNQLDFRPGILHEDVEWTYKVLLAANSFDLFARVYYHYRAHRMGSITYAPDFSRWKMLIDLCEEWFDKQESISNPVLKKRMMDRLILECYQAIKSAAYIDKAFTKDIQEVIISSYFIKHPIGIKNLARSLSIRWFGIRFYFMVLISYNNLKKKIKKIYR